MKVKLTFSKLHNNQCVVITTRLLLLIVILINYFHFVVNIRVIPLDTLLMAIFFLYKYCSYS